MMQRAKLAQCMIASAQANVTDNTQISNVVESVFEETRFVGITQQVEEVGYSNFAIFGRIVRRIAAFDLLSDRVFRIAF